MPLLPSLVTALLSSSKSTIIPPSPCCAYNGEGSALLHGIISVAGIKGFPEPIILDAWLGGDGLTYNSVVINGTTPENATAGWILSNNATSQTLTVYNAGICHTASTPLSTKWVDAFGFCGGLPQGNFQQPIGGFANPLNSYIWSTGNEENPSFMAFTSKENSCAPQFLISTASPLTGGSLSINIIAGSSQEPPLTFSQAPTYC